jgi:transcriptional regulator with XRE-family HTH domain
MAGQYSLCEFSARRCGWRGRGPAAEQPTLSFASLLRQLRARARLTQEELAEAASLSPRSVSDLERGTNRTARKDTVVLVGDALGLAGLAILYLSPRPGGAPRPRRYWRPCARRRGGRPRRYRGAWRAWFRADADQFRRPGRAGSRSDRPAGGVPASHALLSGADWSAYAARRHTPTPE